MNLFDARLHTIRSQSKVCVSVATPKPRSDGTVIPVDELKRLHDGHRFFWVEEKRHLEWRGPASELEDRRTTPYSQAKYLPFSLSFSPPESLDDK